MIYFVKIKEKRTPDWQEVDSWTDLNFTEMLTKVLNALAEGYVVRIAPQKGDNYDK